MNIPALDFGKARICNPCGKAFITPAEAPKEWADWAREEGVSPCCGASYMIDFPEWPEPKPMACGHTTHENGGPSDYGQECRR